MRRSHASFSLPALMLAVAAAASLPGAEPPLRVRADAVSVPCVEAAGRAWMRASGEGLLVEAGALRDRGSWDVLVGSSVELTRALEGGQARVDSDVEIAAVPWVLAVGPAGPAEVRGLDDARRAGTELVMLGGPAAHEARRALAAAAPLRVRETTDPSQLRAAPLALVPLSLAGPGERIAVDVPPIRIGAAVGAGAVRGDAAGDFVRFLGSEEGQRTFAACAPTQ